MTVLIIASIVVLAAFAFVAVFKGNTPDVDQEIERIIGKEDRDGKD